MAETIDQRKEGLHCVYDKCRFMEAGQCNPGCSFTMTAINPLGALRRQIEQEAAKASELSALRHQLAQSQAEVERLRAALEDIGMCRIPGIPSHCTVTADQAMPFMQKRAQAALAPASTSPAEALVSHERKALLILHGMMRQHMMDECGAVERIGCFDIVCRGIDGEELPDASIWVTTYARQSPAPAKVFSAPLRWEGNALFVGKMLMAEVVHSLATAEWFTNIHAAPSKNTYGHQSRNSVVAAAEAALIALAAPGGE